VSIHFYAQQQLLLFECILAIAILSVCLSHGGSVKIGAS